MVNLLDQIRMQMYQRKRKKDTLQAAWNRNRTIVPRDCVQIKSDTRHPAEQKNLSGKAGSEESDTKEIPAKRMNSEELKQKEKDTIVVEKQENVFENILEKVIPTAEKPEIKKVSEKSSDDTLLAQIDEFRVRAQQLQQLLDCKQEKAKELQQIVSEREDKAEKLEKIVKERQVRADGFTEAVEKKMDSMVSKVDAKLDEVKTTINEELKNGQEKEETRAAELKETLDLVSEKVDGMSAVTEQLDTVKADLSEKIHTESVQSYRNISELLKKVEGRLGKLDALETEVNKLRKVTRAIIIFTIINLAGVIVSILANFGFIVFK